MNLSICIPINQSDQVGEARRQIAGLLSIYPFSEIFRGHLSIIVTELANNLIKHTSTGGHLVARALLNGNNHGVEILSVDSGDGMYDVVQCMKDGYSTAGSPGTGLGAISRLSQVFDIYSTKNNGCIVLSQIWSGPLKHSSELQHGAICLPIKNEIVSGDAWDIFVDPQGSSIIKIIVADGLGHGIAASEASQKAISVLSKLNETPQNALKLIHENLHATRGAAVATSYLDLDSQKLTYCSIGNIAGVIQTFDKVQRMFSHNGTAGIQASRIQEFKYDWQTNSILILHSDGISTQWSLEGYKGLFKRHPSIIAGILFRDFNRKADDATIVVLKNFDEGNFRHA